MSVYRRAARRDANEPAIVAALRKVGCSVETLSAPGVPDLLVGRAGRCYLLETKTAKGSLTPEQVAWHQSWRGQVAVVRSVEEALSAVGLAPVAGYGEVCEGRR